MSTVSDESDGPSHFACLDKPIFHDLIRSVQVDENHSWNVTLEAIGHPMPITYTWYHPSGRQLITESWSIGQLSLTRVQRDDRGVYRCVASNEIGNTTVNITVDVLCTLAEARSCPISMFPSDSRRANDHANGWLLLDGVDSAGFDCTVAVRDRCEPIEYELGAMAQRRPRDTLWHRRHSLGTASSQQRSFVNPKLGQPRRRWRIRLRNRRCPCSAAIGCSM